MGEGNYDIKAHRQEIPEYSVVFSGRRSVSIFISPDKRVTVRAPYGTSIHSIDRFVKEKEKWIRTHLDKITELIRINHGKEYTRGELHLFKGKDNYLKITRSEVLFIKQYDHTIEVGLKNTGNSQLISLMLNRWYFNEARVFLKQRFAEIINSNLIYGFFPSGLSVKPLRSRWGSCSSGGTITISSELIKLDPRFADYVIAHELCHLKHHNHGKEFYRLLEKLFPDYKIIRKELSKYLTR